MRIKRDEENGLAAITAIILLALIALSLLASCRTTKTTTTEVYVHDTVHVSHTDTLKVATVQHRTDTVREKEITRIVLRESGDTIKVYNDRYVYRYVEKNDSAVVYKAKVDSLLKVLDQRKSEKSHVKIKQIPTWQYALFVFCVFLLLVFTFKSKIL